MWLLVRRHLDGSSFFWFNKMRLPTCSLPVAGLHGGFGYFGRLVVALGCSSSQFGRGCVSVWHSQFLCSRLWFHLLFTRFACLFVSMGWLFFGLCLSSSSCWLVSSFVVGWFRANLLFRLRTLDMQSQQGWQHLVVATGQSHKRQLESNTNRKRKQGDDDIATPAIIKHGKLSRAPFACI